MNSRSFETIMVVSLLILLALGSVGITQAATFEVPDGDVAALIAAMNAANATDEAGTIILAEGGTYILTSVDNFMGGEYNGLPSITSDITIEGNGATIQRNSPLFTSPLFRIFFVSGEGNLVLNDVKVFGGHIFFLLGASIGNIGTVTLTNSKVGGHPAAVFSDGNIFNEGTMTLINSTVSDNGFATHAGGTGILNFGTMTLTNSTISDNISNNVGGGIFNAGTMTLTGSMVSDNTTNEGFAGGITNFGTVTLTNSTVSGNSSRRSNVPGILNLGTMMLTGSTVSGNIEVCGLAAIVNGGTMTLTNSTVSNNVGEIGGGIANGGTMTVTNSTVSDNNSVSCAGFGAGIHNTGTVTLTNSTVSGNEAGFQGGGINNWGTVILKHTIIAGNSVLEPFYPGPDCFGSPTSEGFNLIGDDTACGFVPTTGDQVGTSAVPVDPRLGPLQNNGGPTETHALLEDSPAIDAVPLANCKDAGGDPLTTDQRGVIRPQDGDDYGTPACDIGAYEVGVFNGLVALSNLINTLPDEELADQLKNSLTSKVENANQLADTNHMCAALIILEKGFQNSVEAQRGKKISDDAATLLIAVADTVIAQILPGLLPGETCNLKQGKAVSELATTLNAQDIRQNVDARKYMTQENLKAYRDALERDVADLKKRLLCRSGRSQSPSGSTGFPVCGDDF